MSIGPSSDDDSSQSEALDEVLDEEIGQRVMPRVFENNSRLDINQIKVNLDHLTGYQGYVSRRLLGLGYPSQQVKTLIQNYPYAQSLEEAVDYLTYDAHGWSHPFISEQ